MLLDMIAIAFWPTIVSFVVAGWLRRTDHSVLTVRWSMAAIIAVVGIGYITFFDAPSLVVLHDIFIGIILFGTLCVLTVYGGHSRLTHVQCIGLSLFGAALIGYGSHVLISDHVLERQAVDGVVRQLRVQDTAKGPNEHLVTIGNETFKATTRLCATLRQGERVRASIGRGSGYIYAIEKL